MALLGAGDPKQKHKLGAGTGDQGSGQQLAQGRPGNPNVNYENANNGHYSFEQMQMETSISGMAYKYYAAASESNRQSSSPSSTQQMLGPGDHRRNGGSLHSSFRSSAGGRLTVPFVKKINWGSLWGKSKEWIRNPVNMALFIWIVAVGVSGAILFMVMTGMLNRVLPSKSQRDTWFEVNNQILNALFTLMCLYQHPRRCYHLALLCRWSAGDMLQLRQAYCKDGTCKPGERKHIMVVLLLLHLNCFAQYALCGLNLGYRRPERPVAGVALTISVAICAPAVAGLYNNLSPLGKDYEAQPQAAADEESPPMTMSNSNNNPQLQQQWVGGLFDLWDDVSLAYLSVLCSCCVFGWNMSRLGLGNMYVHIVTFLLFCLAPFFIFNLAAINIDNEDVRDALGLAGVFLCVLGLLYGGFWRIQMRRRFGLPANHACCGKPDLTDCLQWLCCYSCSLAQEVRTADAYEDEVLLCRRTDYHDSSSSLSHQTLPHHPTLQDELATMQQPLRFAGVFASPPPPPAAAAAAARSVVNDGVTVPPSMSIIRNQ